MCGLCNDVAGKQIRFGDSDNNKKKFALKNNKASAENELGDDYVARNN